MDAILNDLKNIISDTLQVEINQLTDQFKLMDNGLDSLLAMKLAAKFYEVYHLRLPVTLLFKNITIKEISEYIALNNNPSKESNDGNIKVLDKSLPKNLEEYSDREIDSLSEESIDKLLQAYKDN